MARHRSSPGLPVGNQNQKSSTPSTPPPARSSLSLIKVLEINNQDQMRENSIQPSVIAIPGYGTPPINSWRVHEELRQAARHVESVSNLNIYMHQPSYESRNDFTWEAFLKAGSDIAEEVAKLSLEFPDRPIIFIVHSLGGLLLKQALLLANQNLHDNRFKTLLECLSGIIFLGTPHAGITDEDTLLRHNQLLYNCAKVATQKDHKKLPAHDMYQLANLAATFERIANMPVLSVFEIGQTRSRVQKLLGSKKVFVDEQLATISSRTERLFGVPITHNELCRLSLLKDDAYSAREFLRSIFERLEEHRKEVTIMRSLETSEPTVSDPLNPLNLTTVEQVKEVKPSPQSSKEGKKTKWDLSHKISEMSLSSPLLSATNDMVLGTRKAHLPCYKLPEYSQNLDFVGREAALLSMTSTILPTEPALSEASQDLRYFALCGMGGIGKTELAIKFALSQKDMFDAVFWLTAASHSQLAAGFGRIGIELGLQREDERMDLESSKELAKAWFQTPRESGIKNGTTQSRPWLLVFDNVDSLDIITDYLPRRGNGAVLVTSRDPSAKTYFFSHGSGIDMDPLSTAESVTLLCRLTMQSDKVETDDEQNASETVAKFVDGLPLAMTQMAGFIRRRHLLIREFVSLYANDTRYAEVREAGNPELSYRYGYTYATAFSFQDLSDDAMELLQVLAFLSPDRISEDIFLQPSKGLTQIKHFWDSPLAYANARFELISSSIIKRNIARKELSIHRVIQTEVRARMSVTEQYYTFMTAVSLLANIWPPGNLSSQFSQRWSICESLLPHLERFHQLWDEDDKEWGRFEVESILPSLFNEAGIYLRERGFPFEGIAYLNLAFKLCDEAGITEQPLLGDMHLTMTALTNAVKDAQGCMKHNIACLAMRKAEAVKNGRPDLRLAFAHSQMGIAYMGIKKFALATAYFQQSIAMLKGLNADVEEFGFPVANLGLAYWIQGQLEEADDLLTNELSNRKARWGSLDNVSYKTGRVLHALGNVKIGKALQLEAEGDLKGAEQVWNEAFTIHTNCLAQYESTLGKFHNNTGDICHKLAEHHIHRREDDLAQDYLDRALGIYGNRPAFRHESSRSSFLRGVNLQSLGGEENIEKGKRWIERAKEIRREILPGEKQRDFDIHDFDKIVLFWSI